MELYDFQLYELLKARIGEKDAATLARQIPKIRMPQEAKDVLATKEDIAMLKEDIINTRILLLKWLLIAFLTLVVAVLGLYAA